MKASYLFVASAVLGLIFGVGLLVFPAQTTGMYGVTLDDVGVYLARLVGGSLLSFAVLAWLVRNAPASPERRPIILTFLVANLLALVVNLLAQLGGLANSLGWSTVVIYLIFTVGFGYLFFAGAPGAARTEMTG